MALWMEKGTEPQTEKEQADLDAIAALKESAAVELKEKGNQYVKMGRKHYADAIDCYTRAINQNIPNDFENSLIYANRAHVNLLLGNFRRALVDAEASIHLCPTNIKAHYRAAKAAFSLDLLTQATSFCQSGLDLSSSNDELKKLLLLINLQKSEQTQHEVKVSKALSEAKDIVFAISSRKLNMGKAMFQELTGMRKPMLDKNNVLHWPVLFLYPEVMSSDFIEDFCETDTFSFHLDMMFSEVSPSIPWDEQHAYTRQSIELYYQANSISLLSKREVLCFLLEGTVASHVENIGDDDKDVGPSLHTSDTDSSKWIKVQENKTLLDVLSQQNYVTPGIPVFYVVSSESSFYKMFKGGKWSPP